MDALRLEFTAEADIRGRGINLNCTWIDDGEPPAFRLVRRQRAYPMGPEDGLTLLDLTDLVREPGALWARMERMLYWVSSSPSTSPAQAQVTLYFAGADDRQPNQITVAYYDAMAVLRVTRIERISRMERSQMAVPPWAAVDTLDIFVTAGEGQGQQAGRFVVSSGHEDGQTPDRLEWLPTGQPSAVNFDYKTSQFYTSSSSVVAGDWKRRVTLRDMDLEAEVVYCYALFPPDLNVPGKFNTSAAWRASAMTTGNYGMDGRLYDLLPAFYRYYDEPTPARAGQGQLRSFLEILGLGLDQVRSLAEGLRGRHDVLNVHAGALPHLARWIGWDPDLTLNELAQRRDILFAPAVFESTGTILNIKALVNRVTGWECRVKEFVNNVFLSNATETIRLWEIWGQRSRDGITWDAPAAITHTDGFDGRPAAVRDSAGIIWLFWHSDRSGRREIWMHRLDKGSAPRRAVLGAPDDAPGLTFIDEDPVAIAHGKQIWLFWSSNRAGQWDIWCRVYDGLQGRDAIRLTDHPAEDRRPAVAHDKEANIWLFWQSNRRGPTDIWSRMYNGTDWSQPARLTTAKLRDEMPAAVLDGDGRIWLFWSADLGDRRSLYYQVRGGGEWSTARVIMKGLRRDESPTAVFWNQDIWLFWHSDCGGHWQICGRQIGRRLHDRKSWGLPFQVTTNPAADKQPAAVVDSDGHLRLYWQSQRRGMLDQSRTIDTNDAEMLARLKRFDDRAHYTYDTGGTCEDWYARGMVGLYLAADTEDPDFIQSQLDRVKGFVEPFRPLPVTFVWQILPSVNELVEETINSDGLIGEEFQDEVKS